MFRNVIGLPNICRNIDGTHIPLTKRLSSSITPWSSDFFNKKKIHSDVLQALCNMNKIFWNVCAAQPSGVYDVVQFWWSSLYQELWNRTILSEPIIEVKCVRIQPYLISDSAYPSQPYLLKNFKSGSPDCILQGKRLPRLANT